MKKGNEIKMIVPALRFSEFITGKHWYISKIKDIYQITRGQILAVSLVKEVKDDIYIYPVYSSQTKNGGLVGYYKDYLYENAITWTTDGANAGDVNYRDGKFYCTNVCGVLLNQKGFSNKCMAEIINSVTRNYVSYVGNPKLMNGVMGDIIISVPPTIEEQQKIADCLSSLDELIEATTQKVEALKKHKKGLMQRLFPAEGKNVPDLRFPEFQGTSVWEEKKLGEVGKFIGGGTPNTTNPEYWDGEILWYTPTEIKNGRLNSSNRKITEQGLKNSSAKLLPKGAILITTRATIGDVTISEKVCTTNQGFQSLVVKDSEVNSFWFYWIIQHKEELIKRASGSTFKEIGKNEIINIIAYSTKKQEQQKIADCLSSLDELIEATSRKVEILKEHKKGLMQQLFPKI